MTGKIFLKPAHICLIALFAINIFLYSHSADSFYLVDDVSNLVRNNHLMIEELNLKTLKNAALSSQSSRFYRPISMLTFAANYTLAGNKDTFSVKLTNIYLHVIIGLGIYLLTMNLLPYFSELRSEKGTEKNIELIAILATALWLFHPLFVSTLLYAIQRMAILSTLFVIYGCLSYIKLRQRTINTNSGYLLLFFSIAVFTLLGFFSKENGALLPVFLLLIEYFCFRFTLHETTDKRIKYCLLSILLAPTVFILGFLIYSYIQYYDFKSPPHFINSHERLLTETRVMWQYLGWLLFINWKSMGLFHDDIVISQDLFTPVSTFISLTVWLCVILLSLVFLKRRNIFVFSVFWFLVGHSLESSTIPLMAMFEHRNYLPGYGPLLGFSVLCVKFINIQKWRLYIKFGFLTIFFLLLPMSKALERIDNWSNPKDFFTAQLLNKPKSQYSLISAAAYLRNRGDYTNARQAIELARSLDNSESAYIFSDAAIHCMEMPDKKFSETLATRLTNEADFNRVTLYFVYEFSNFNALCILSKINHDVLLEVYENAGTSDIMNIQAVADFYKGMIYLQRKDYDQAVKALAWTTDENRDEKKLRQELEELRIQFENSMVE